jgi:hypothetical protein
MTIRSIVDLLAEVNAKINDNNVGDITPAELRQLFVDLLDTVSPAYGAIECSGDSISTTATPQVVAPFTASINATAGYYTVNLTNGSVTRLIASASIAGATDFIIVDGAVEGGNNELVTLALYKNGAPTPYEVGVTCQGAGRPVGFNLAGITYTDGATDAVYDVRVTGDAGNKVFSDVSLIVQAQPVRSFV